MKLTAYRRAAHAALVLLATTGIKFPTSAQTPKSYTVTTLSGLPSAPYFGSPFNSSFINAINNTGTMAGYSNMVFSFSGPGFFVTSLAPSGVSWDATGAITNVFDPLFPAPHFNGIIQSLNDSNVMVGVVRGVVVSTGIYMEQPTLFSPSGITPLQIPGTSGYAKKINNSNQTVGYYSDSNNASVACLWDLDGTRTDLALPGSSANDINDAGTVVGDYHDAFGIDLPFVWTSAHGFQPLPFVGTTATANAINNAGTIAGKVDGHAVLWINGIPRDIHNAGSQSETFRVFDDGSALTTVAFLQPDQSTVSFDCLNDGVQTHTLLSMVPQSFTGTNINAQGINAKSQIVGATGNFLAFTANFLPYKGILLTPSNLALPHPLDVTARVSISFPKPRYDRTLKKWLSVVTITNNSMTDIVGPLYIVPVMKANSQLRGFNGLISTGNRTGQPFWSLNPDGNGSLVPGASLSYSFSSTLSVVDLRTYTPVTVAAVLAGAGRP